MIHLLRAALLLLCLSAVAYADAGREDALPSQESSNYSKATQLLPGEEVVTPTGQRLKVWSTRGPVEVSKAPEPFDEGQPLNNDVHVVIDGLQLRNQNQQNQNLAVTQVGVASETDSFDHGGATDGAKDSHSPR